MKPNRLIEKMDSGTPGLNGWLVLGSVAVAEVMAHQPWDSLTIDMQHGLSDFDTTVQMLRAIQTTEVTPIVRVPWSDPAMLMRILDAGAAGVICPMVNTRAQCEAFVSACRYAPQGSRSFGPTRAPLVSGPDYWRHANEQVLTFAMIETREALDNLDAILAVPGLSGVYIGPADLSLSLGFDPIHDQNHPTVRAAIERIRSAAVAAGKYTVMHCSAVDYAQTMLGQGFHLVTVSNDQRLLTLMQQQVFGELRGALAGAAAPVAAY